jgi:hypothetical protein
MLNTNRREKEQLCHFEHSYCLIVFYLWHLLGLEDGRTFFVKRWPEARLKRMWRLGSILLPASKIRYVRIVAADHHGPKILGFHPDRFKT